MLSLNESVFNLAHLDLFNLRRLINTQINYHVHIFVYNDVMDGCYSNAKKTAAPPMSAIKYFMEGRITEINFND
jgi:hypothetical protein